VSTSTSIDAPVTPVTTTPVSVITQPAVDQSVRRSSRLASIPAKDYAAIAKNKVSAKAAKSNPSEFNPNRISYAKGINGKYGSLLTASAIKEIKNIFIVMI
jgi:hypothetical protein